MTKVVRSFLSCALLASATSAFAVDPSLLRTDLVVVKGNAMTVDDVRLCTEKVDPQVTKQVSVKAEAPVSGVISRDRFVAIYGMLIARVLTDYDCRPVASLTGEPDISLKMVMTTDGIQFRVDNSGKVDRFTKTWAEM